MVGKILLRADWLSRSKVVQDQKEKHLQSIVSVFSSIFISIK